MSHESRTCSCRLVQFKSQCILLLPSILKMITHSLAPTACFRPAGITNSLNFFKMQLVGVQRRVKCTDSVCECNRVISSFNFNTHTISRQKSATRNFTTSIRDKNLPSDAGNCHICHAWTGLDVRELLPIAFHNQRDGRVWKHGLCETVLRV